MNNLEKFLSTGNLENFSNRKLFLIFPWRISKEKTTLSYFDPFSVKKNIFPRSVTLFPLKKIQFPHCVKKNCEEKNFKCLEKSYSSSEMEEKLRKYIF